MATSQRDYYEILGVARTASEGEIKKAFRSLARQHHPDLKPGDRAAEKRFKDVNEAYEVLGDPEKRKLYDEFGEEGLQAGFDPDRSESMLFIAQDDPAVLLELRTMLDEIEWLLHDLAIEDAYHAHQRPKLERYGDSLFAVLRTAHLDRPTGAIEFGDITDPKSRVSKAKASTRTYGALTYTRVKSAEDVVLETQAADSVSAGAWQTLTTIHRSVDLGDKEQLTILDDQPASTHEQRFYRLRVKLE